MKRDWEFLRQLLFILESLPPGKMFSMGQYQDDYPEVDREKLVGHIKLLIDAGFVIGKVRSQPHSQEKVVSLHRLTWDGHEYLDTIRDPVIWAKVKNSAEEIGSFGIDTLRALAKGFIKTKIMNHTGIDI